MAFGLGEMAVVTTLAGRLPRVPIRRKHQPDVGGSSCGLGVRHAMCSFTLLGRSDKGENVPLEAWEFWVHN